MAVLVGLDSIHVAKITEAADGAITYAPPVKILNAIDAKITPSVDTQNIFADDGVAEILSVFSSVDVEFTVKELGSENYALLLGKEKDANGVTIDNADDLAPFFALGFRAKKSNNEYRYVWLYKGRFAPVDEAYQTQADKADSQTQAVKGTFIKRKSDGAWRAKAESDDVGVLPATISGWFTEVYESTPVAP